MSSKYKKDSFVGGMADGSKVGYSNSFQDGMGLDFRSDPDKLTALKQFKKDSGSTVTDLVKWMIEYKGSIWMYGDTGKIYKRDSAATYTNPKSVSNSTGQGMAQFNTLNEDALWYASSTQIGKVKNLPTPGASDFLDDYFKSHTTESEQTGGGTANSYTTPTSVNEGSTHRQTFTAGKDNIVGVALVFNTKGTGDITVIIHDSSNVLVCQKTYTNASLPSGAFRARIEFGGKYTLTVGNSYHIHVISTVADATVQTSTSSDLEAAYFTTLYYYNDLDRDQISDLRTQVNWQLAYQLPTAISETAANRRSFVPTKTSLAAISISVHAASASWTLTVHDPNDRVIGTATATPTNAFGFYYRFEFSSALVVIPGVTYHFHLTSATGSQYVVGTSASDLSVVGYITHFAVLNADVDFHPMKVAGIYLLIGNGDSVAVLDDTESYDPERVRLPRGEKVRAIEIIGSYAAIATWQGTSLSDYGESVIYLWDLASPGFNEFITISGQVNALKTEGTAMYMIHGTEGKLRVYRGSTTPLRRMKGVGENKTVEVYPGAITAWEGLLYFAPSGGTTTTLDRVVHAYGTRDKDYPMSLSKDYPISTGNYGSLVKFGCLLGVNSSLFLASWKDETTGSAVYGVDIIDTANDQKQVYVQTLRYDAERPNELKQSKSVTVRTSILTTDDNVTIQYRINNNGPFLDIEDKDGSLDGENSPNIFYSSFDLNLEWFEIEFRVVLSGKVDAPSLLSLEMEYEFREGNEFGELIYEG